MHVVSLDPRVDNLSLTYEHMSSFVIEIYLFNEDKTSFQVRQKGLDLLKHVITMSIMCHEV